MREPGAAVYRVHLEESYFPAQADDEIRPSTVAGVLRDAAADSADVTALTEIREDGAVGRSWTYGALLAESERLADALLLRFAPGERVAIWSPNTPEWAIFEFAAAIAGLTLVTVNPAFQAKELRYVLEQSRAAGLYAARSFRGNPMAAIAQGVCDDLPAIRHLVDLDDPTAIYTAAGAARARPVVAPKDAAQIQYTSGTTGFPKGAVLTHVGLTNNARLCFARLGARRGDVYLNVMPMFHTSGCATGLLGAVQWRCPLLMARLFQPAVMNAIIAQERVSLLVAVPTMLIGLLEEHGHTPRDMSSLRVVMSGGAMVPPELVRNIQDTFGCRLAIIYGQTEASPGLTLTRPTDSFADQVESVGQAFPQTEISIRDRASNAVVPIGAAGEICGRGYCTMLGYNDNPQATEEALDAEGWLHTGDLGTMDDRGYVRVTGRVKDMIIRGGENLFPAEIENVIATHPGVAEVAVVGVPDPKWGEIAVCFFRAATSVLPSRTDLVAHIRRDLAAPKTPSHFIVVDSFPLTGSGKIQKFVLRDRYVAGDFSGHTL
jgi:fatty-acyl-CoA synthase